MSAKVYRARRKYRIPYPNQYGDEVKHKQFNCMQVRVLVGWRYS